MEVYIKRSRGALKVCINDRLYTLLSFKFFRPNPQNIYEFYNAGVRLFSVLSSGIISALGVPYSHFGELLICNYKTIFMLLISSWIYLLKMLRIRILSNRYTSVVLCPN